MRKIFTPLLAAVCVAGLAVPASAEEVTVSIHYSDLDINTSEGAETLNKRLAVAMRRACRSMAAGRLTERVIEDECLASGLANGERVIAEHRSKAADLAANSR